MPLPVAFWGLDNQAHSDRLGRYPDTTYAAVNDRPDALDVGFELALGDTCRLAPDAPKILGLTSAGDGAARTGLLSSKVANTRHTSPRDLDCTRPLWAVKPDRPKQASILRS